MSASLSLRGVHRSFGTNHVLRGIDLEVGAGTLTAVLGPSGGGKTTLLRLIAGFDRPDAGEVAIDGSVVGSPHRLVPAERRRVAIVPQEGALFPHLDVAGNVGFGLARRSRTERQRRIAEMLELVGLPGAEHARPHELSGGMQHRVALARALAPDPAVVLLDEPFSSLDAGLRAGVRADVVAALRASGATAVLVTHDQAEALATADQLAVLLDGRIADHGEPAALYANPASIEAALFLGDAVLFEGIVHPSTDHASPQTAECRLGTVEVIGPADPGPARLMFRPEALRVGPPGAEDRNAANGTVTGREFYGHDGTITVRLDDGAIEVTARMDAPVLPTLGTRVSVRAAAPARAFR